MQKRKVISHKNTPPSMRLMSFAVVWLLMDRFQPPGWVWGVVGTVCVIVLILNTIGFFASEVVDIFEKPDAK